MKAPLVVTSLFSLTLAGPLASEELAIPLHPDEAEVVRLIIESEGVPVQESTPRSWATKSTQERLAALGVDADGLEFWSFHDAKAKNRALIFAYRPDGRTLSISGNGPWLQNEVLRAMKAMPELRSIRLDHNVRPEKGWDYPPYSGQGFDGLIDSKLLEVKIGHGFNNLGAEALAKIPGLKSVAIGHSRMDAEGLAFFKGHAGITSLTVAEMGKIPASALAIYATLPNLTQASFKEAYVSYENGLDHLEPMAGQLKSIDLRMNVVSAADLEALKEAHPEAEVLTNTPEEIAKGHIGVARRLVRLAPPELAGPLEAAVERAAAERKK